MRGTRGKCFSTLKKPAYGAQAERQTEVNEAKVGETKQNLAVLRQNRIFWHQIRAPAPASSMVSVSLPILADILEPMTWWTPRRNLANKARFDHSLTRVLAIFASTITIYWYVDNLLILVTLLNDRFSVFQVSKILSVRNMPGLRFRKFKMVPQLLAKP